MRSRKRFRLAQLPWRGAAVLLGCALLCSALELSGALASLELKSSDLRVALRGKLRSASPGPSQPRRIALIEIDDESAKRIPEPYILWDKHFARLFDALAGSGALVISADILWLKAIDDFLELGRDSPRKTLVKAMLRGRDRLVLAELGETASAASERVAGGPGAGASLGKYALMIGPEHFAIVNPVYDQDGVVRRQRPSYTLAGRSGRAGQAPAFSYLAASLYNGKPLPAGQEPMLLDFDAARLPFDRIPFHEALARAEAGDSAWFNASFGGKIALLGTTSSITDRHPTPIGRQTPGVWSHAFAMDAFLDPAPLRPSAKSFDLLMVNLLCLLAGVAALRLAWVPSLLCAASMAAAWLGAAQVMFQHRLVVGFAGPLAAIVVTTAVVLLYRFAIADRDKLRLTKVLKGYVNPKMVEAALNAPDNADILKGSRRHVAILFSDIRGFTKISEGLPPERVVRFLNRYLTAMSDVILDHDGTIDKFVGDSVMGFFGAPVKHANPPLLAVKVALEMRRRLAELNAEWAHEGLAEVEMGIGIHAGEAIVGNIGSTRKMDYTAIGDTTNLASRVQSLTKDYKRHILITEEVYERVKKDVDVEAMGVAEVRGHSSVPLYAVVGLKDSKRKETR